MKYKKGRDIIKNYDKYTKETTINTLDYYTNLELNDPIKIGMREILISTILKKHHLDVKNMKHTEEVKLASELMKLFGYDIMIKLFFLKTREGEIKLIIKEMGEEAAGLYWYICDLATNSYNTHLFDSLKKADYSKIYKIVDSYNIHLNNNVKIKHKSIFRKILSK